MQTYFSPPFRVEKKRRTQIHLHSHATYVVNLKGSYFQWLITRFRCFSLFYSSVALTDAAEQFSPVLYWTLQTPCVCVLKHNLPDQPATALEWHTHIYSQLSAEGVVAPRTLHRWSYHYRSVHQSEHSHQSCKECWKLIRQKQRQTM